MRKVLLAICKNMPFNLNAATLLFGTVGNSLSLRCSEKPALTLVIFTAKLSSECINMNKQFFFKFENRLLEASFAFPKSYHSFEFFSRDYS